MTEPTLKVFISHSNNDIDKDLVEDEVIPKLETKGIEFDGRRNFIPGYEELPSIMGMVNPENTHRSLLFVSKNTLDSPWCSFELLISLERAQRTDRMSVVLLLHDVEEAELPHVAVLQEAPKIKFTAGTDEWVDQAVEHLMSHKSLSKEIMTAGNVAHGLVWSHYAGYQQYVIPVLKEKLEASEWYTKQSAEIKSKVSSTLYELVCKSCTVKYDLSKEDPNIEFIEKLHVDALMRGGNHRDYYVSLYSVTDGQETFYFMCECPAVVGTMKVMTDQHLATFCHNYSSGADNSDSTAPDFTSDDKTLHLNRFYFTMNSVLGHFEDYKSEDYIPRARVLLFNDVDEETQSLSQVLIHAIKEDLHQTDKIKKDADDSQLQTIDGRKEMNEYKLYIAHTDDDREKASEIYDWLLQNGLSEEEILLDKPGLSFGAEMQRRVEKCRWFVILLTENALQDRRLNFTKLSALGNSIEKKKVRVIPIVDQKEDLYIPEDLKWSTYIPFDETGNQKHCESLYNIVNGRDIPMETQFILPAGDVAYGLAWGYVTNYLMKILPNVLDEGIVPAFDAKNVDEKDYRCPHKLYVIIPKSCDAPNTLKEGQQDNKRIQTFTQTAPVYPFGPVRAFHCSIYKVETKETNLNEQGLYFVGQYAAPATCLSEMKGWNIAGVKEDTMASEAMRFYKIVKNLMENVVPDKAKFCDFVFFDDEKESLADIMVTKIRTDDEKGTSV